MRSTLGEPKLNKTFKKPRKTEERRFPLIRGEKGIICTQVEKTEAFRNCLKMECWKNKHPDKNKEEEEVTRTVRTLRKKEAGRIIEAVTSEEVKNTIKVLKRRRAPRRKEINNRPLNKLTRKEIVFLTIIIHEVLRLLPNNMETRGRDSNIERRNHRASLPPPKKLKAKQLTSIDEQNCARRGSKKQ